MRVYIEFAYDFFAFENGYDYFRFYVWAAREVIFFFRDILNDERLSALCSLAAYASSEGYSGVYKGENIWLTEAYLVLEIKFWAIMKILYSVQIFCLPIL